MKINHHGNFSPEGYFEEVFVCDDGLAFHCAGTRVIEWDGIRSMGEAGMVETSITQNLVLNKGHKRITVKASAGRPITIRTAIYPLCGRSVKP